MGYKILPGHKEYSHKGWREYKNIDNDLLNDIKIGSFSIGNFGRYFSRDEDKFSAHYSIPNPWAAAYLFHYVIQSGGHPLQREIFDLILNLLNDIYNRNLSIIRLSEEEISSSFKKFWDFLPEFLKINNSAYFLEDKNDRIVGGISKTTLVWAAQQYQPSKELESLTTNKEFADYICYIKEMEGPLEIEGMKKQVFWGYPWLTSLITLGKSITEYEKIPESPNNWFVRKSITPETIKLDDNYMFNGRIILDLQRKEDLKSKMENQNLKLPEDVIFYEDMFEKNWVKLPQLSSDKRKKGFFNNFLLPIKPEYLKLGFDIGLFVSKDLSTNEKAVVSENEEYFGNKIVQKIHSESKHFVHYCSGKVYEDKRSIAVWPSFSSKILPTYIIEYSELEPFRGKLEFYDKSGNKLEHDIIRDDKDTRVYRLKELDKFPYLLRVNSFKEASGFMRLFPKEILKTRSTEVSIGLDFGSTNTTIAFLENDEKAESDILSFEESAPLIISDINTQYTTINDFVPISILKSAPQDKEYFPKEVSRQLYQTWSPVRTIWKIFDTTEESFLKNGIVPLTYNPEHLQDIKKRKNYKDNIKWSSKSEFREGFLKYILNLILINCEAQGKEKVRLFWSYPRAFSQQEQNSMEKFYEKFLKVYQEKTKSTMSLEISEIGYSEALRTKDYFVYKQKKLTQSALVATIDIGGGTSDITFLQSHKLLWEDSVKFGGDDITPHLNEIVTQLNEIRLKENRAKLDVQNSDYNQIVRIWPAVSSDWDGKMVDFLNSNNSGSFFEKIALFYGGICYFLGLHMRRKINKNALDQIAFAGNGSQFLKICSEGLNLSNRRIPEWLKLFRHMIAAGQAIDPDDYKESEFVFTDEPKREVAYGLTFVSNLENKNEEKKVEKMLGVSINGTFEGKPISYNYDSWIDEKISSSEIASNFKFDYTVFKEFLEIFYRFINENAVNTQFQKIIVPKSIDLDKPFNREVVIDVEQRMQEPLASPIFFTALKIWINKISKKYVG